MPLVRRAGTPLTKHLTTPECTNRIWSGHQHDDVSGCQKLACSWWTWPPTYPAPPQLLTFLDSITWSSATLDMASCSSDRPASDLQAGMHACCLRSLCGMPP